MARFISKKFFIAILLIIAIGAGAVFFRHWKASQVKQKNQTNSTNQANSISQEEATKQCLQKSGELSLGDLTDKILEKQVKGVDDLTRESFACQLIKNKDQALYDRALDFIKSGNWSEDIKKQHTRWLGRIFSGEYSFSDPRYINNLAVGDLGKICPGELPKICFDSLNNYSQPSDAANNVKYCNNLCAALVMYANNPVSFADDMNNGKAEASFLLDLPKTNTKFYLNKFALIYRFEGREALAKVCDSLEANDPQKNDCTTLIDGLGKRYSCEELPAKLAEALCKYGPLDSSAVEQCDATGNGGQ